MASNNSKDFKWRHFTGEVTTHLNSKNDWTGVKKNIRDDGTWMKPT